jgi:1-acyl-sn-glycerol-3-phosphate acyltransferase
MRTLLKVTAAAPVLAAYLLLSTLLSLLPAGARARRFLLVRNTSFFSRLMLALLGVRVQVKHRERLKNDKIAKLVVSNHVSYVDVLVISSLIPSAFITSVELGGTFFLGLLARLGGSLFVERRKASGLKREIAAITQTLRNGVSVTLFPEGTTSNGDTVRVFKKALFDAALAAKTRILPICLRYTAIDDGPLTDRNRDSVFYYGGAVFFRHIAKFLALQSTDVIILPLKSIPPTSGTDRKELAAAAHREILDAYHESSHGKTERARSHSRASA